MIGIILCTYSKHKEKSKLAYQLASGDSCECSKTFIRNSIVQMSTAPTQGCLCLAANSEHTSFGVYTTGLRVKWFFFLLFYLCNTTLSSKRDFFIPDILSIILPQALLVHGVDWIQSLAV